MKSLIILTLILSMKTVLAGTCISLESYNLTPVNNYSASELDDFKKKKFEIYRSFILNENKLTNYYSREIQLLYETENSDQELTRKVNALQVKKENALKQNCDEHKKQLKDLLNLF